MRTEIYNLNELDGKHIDFKSSELVNNALIILFDNEINLVEITHKCNRKINNELYLQSREETWNNLKQEYSNKLWNGIVYTIESLRFKKQKLIIEMGICEYKDIILKNKLGFKNIKAKFGNDAIAIHTFTAGMPVTRDGDLALGIVGEGTYQAPGEADFIGGTLNVDSLQITNINDIKKITAQEFEEELGLDIPYCDFRLFSLNYYNGCCFFLFKLIIQDRNVFLSFKENKEIKDILWVPFEKLNICSPVTNDVRFFMENFQRIKDKCHVYNTKL